LRSYNLRVVRFEQFLNKPSKIEMNPEKGFIRTQSSVRSEPVEY